MGIYIFSFFFFCVVMPKYWSRANYDRIAQHFLYEKYLLQKNAVFGNLYVCVSVCYFKNHDLDRNNMIIKFRLIIVCN